MMEDMFHSEWGPLLFWAPLVSILALLVVALVYFLAPALGYTSYNRGLLLGSLWVLVAKMALMIFKMGLLFLQALDNPSSGPALGGNAAIVSMLFSMLEAGMFILAMALFIGGLASLRRDPDLVRPPPPPRFPND
jgi:hypothetical protein